MLENHLTNKFIPKHFRTNNQIRAPKVRLIDEAEKQLGIISLGEALKLGQEKGLDLVEVAPQDNPPVCKLMDYGKYLYRQKKIEQKHKRLQKKAEIKGIRIGFRTDVHDIEVKTKKAKKFFQERNPVKISLVFKGREMMHKNLAREKLNSIAENLKEVAKIEQMPKMQGNTMIMILTPLSKSEVKTPEKETTEKAKVTEATAKT